MSSLTQRLQQRMAVAAESSNGEGGVEGDSSKFSGGAETSIVEELMSTLTFKKYRPKSFDFPLKHTLSDFLIAGGDTPGKIAPPAAATHNSAGISSPFARVEDTPMWLRIKTLLVKLEEAEQVRQQSRRGVYDSRREILKSTHGVDMGSDGDTSPPSGKANTGAGGIKRRGGGGILETQYEGVGKANTTTKASAAPPAPRTVRIRSTAEVFDYNTMVPGAVSNKGGAASSLAGPMSPSRIIVPLVDATKGNAGPLRRVGTSSNGSSISVVDPSPSVDSSTPASTSLALSTTIDAVDRPQSKEEKAYWARAEELKLERERRARALDASLVAFGLPPEMFGAITPTATGSGSSGKTAVAQHRSDASKAASSPTQNSGKAYLSPDIVQGYFAVKTLLNPLPAHDSGLIPFVCEDEKSSTAPSSSSLSFGGGAPSSSAPLGQQQKLAAINEASSASPLKAHNSGPNAHTTATVRIATSAIKFCNEKELEQKCQHFVTQLLGRIREGQRQGGGEGEGISSVGELLYSLHSSISADTSKHHHSTSTQFQRYLRTYLFSTSTATIQYRLSHQLRTIKGAVVVKLPTGEINEGGGVTVTPFSKPLSGVLEGAFQMRTDLLNPASGAKGSTAIAAAAEASTTTIAALGALSGATTVFIPSYPVENAVAVNGNNAALRPSSAQRDTLQYIAATLNTVAKRIQTTTSHQLQQQATNHPVSRPTTSSGGGGNSQSPGLATDQRLVLLQAGTQLGLVGTQHLRGTQQQPRIVTRLELQTHAFYRDRHILPDTTVPSDVVSALRSHSWSEYKEYHQNAPIEPTDDIDITTNASSATLLAPFGIGGGASRTESDPIRHKSLLSFRGPLGRSTAAAKRASISGQKPITDGHLSSVAPSLVGGPGQSAAAPLRVGRATKLVNTSRRTKVLFQTHASGFGPSGRWGTLNYILYGIRPEDFAQTKEHLARIQRRAQRRQLRAQQQMMGGEDVLTSDSDDNDGKANRMASIATSVGGTSRSLSRMMSTLSMRGGQGGGALPRTTSQIGRRFSTTSSIFTAFDDEDEGGDGGGGETGVFSGLGGGGPPPAFIRRYVGPTPDGTAYLYYPQSRLPILKGVPPESTLAATTMDNVSASSMSTGPADAPTNETTLTLVSTMSGKSTIHGTIVAESHWFSFLGIVFDGSSCRERLLGGGGGVAKGSAAGRLLYYTMVFVPAFSGRDFTSFFLSQRNMHNIFDFGDIGPRDSSSVAAATTSPTSSTAASLSSALLGMSNPLGTDTAARSQALMDVLALLMNDFEVVGVLEGGGNMCKALVL